MKKVLLLGGAGFIGFNIAQFLAKNRDYKITIADSFARGKMDEHLSELVENHDITVIEGDFTNPDTYKRLENDYDYMYMLASVVGVNNTLQIPHEIIRINTALIYNTLEWLKHSEVKKVLFTSTSECYAGTIDTFGYKVPTPEEIPLCTTKSLPDQGQLHLSACVRWHTVFLTASLDNCRKRPDNGSSAFYLRGK